MKLAKRLKNIEPFHVMDLLAKAKSMEAKGRDIIHLEVGEPDFSSPKAAIEGAQQALENGHTHYTAATGLPELRQAISKFYRQRYGKRVSPERIMITPGASGALQLIMSLLVDPGEMVMLSDPGYPCNRHFLANIEAKGQMVETGTQDGFQLTPQALSQNWQSNTVAALVASPANPTGAVMTRSQLVDLHDAITEKDGILMVDEIYHGLSYNVDTDTAVDLGDNVFVINSFSKYFTMTGWRLGWLVAPEWAMAGLDKLAQNLFLAPSTPAQYAALNVFEENCINELEQRREIFSERLNYLLPALESLGFVVPVVPQGAFYIYADISQLHHGYSHDSKKFCLALLEQEGVAITPGIDFSQHHGNHFVRFAYTADISVLKVAVERIKIFLQ